MHLSNGELMNNTMKNLFIKFCRVVLPILGFSSLLSCEGLIINNMVDHGVPHSTFKVKCKVVDSKTKNPVRGIILTPGERDRGDNDIFIAISEGVEGDSEGNFYLNGICYYNYDELHVKLIDLDPLKDGSYKDTIYVVPLTKIRDSKENWNKGTYGANVTLEAEQVKDNLSE